MGWRHGVLGRTFEAGAVPAASLLAGASLFLRRNDALSAAWDAIAVLNGLRFLAYDHAERAQVLVPDGYGRPGDEGAGSLEGEVEADATFANH